MIRDCGVNNKLDCVSDHLLIVTTLEYLTTELLKVAQKKYKDIDIEMFTCVLQKGLLRD
jgi:hypothetical protein